MRKHALITLLSCAIVSASALCAVHAQTAPAGAAPGGRGGRGGGGGGRGGAAQVPPGPPAPVPPEVMMMRPTADEVAKINADLMKFAESNSSPDKDLLKKYESLLTVQMPRDNACIRPAPSARGNRHTGLVQIANTGDFDVMFIGDSITDLLGAVNDGQGNPGGKPEVDKYFSDVKIGNFGVSGDTTQGVLWGFQNGEGQGHKPKAIMLMIGTNNMNANTSGEEVAEGIGADILELRKDFPDAKILLLAIFRGATPADANRKKVEACNKIIAKLDDQKHVFFMRINDKFLDDKGGLVGFRTSDNLHPVSKGFDIWLSSVAPTLKGWLK